MSSQGCSDCGRPNDEHWLGNDGSRRCPKPSTSDDFTAKRAETEATLGKLEAEARNVEDERLRRIVREEIDARLGRGAAVQRRDPWDPKTRFGPVFRTPVERMLADALRLTVEYVGNEVLPAVEGWSWFDALKAVDPDAAQQFVDHPVYPSPRPRGGR